MRTGRTAWTALVVAGSILFAVGFGPAAGIGVADILYSGAMPIAGTTILIGIIAVCLAGSFIFITRLNPDIVRTATRRNISVIAAGTFAIAILAFVVANVDKANNSAWRDTNRFVTGPGVIKTSSTEYGHYYVKLRTEDVAARNEQIGFLPVDWSSWAAGGEWEFLLRVQDSAQPGPRSICDEDVYLRIVAVDRVQALAEKMVPVSEYCGRWERLRVEASRGVEGLRFETVGHLPENRSGVDVMLVAERPNFYWTWAACTVLAIASLLIFILLLSVKTRDSEADSVPRRLHGRTSIPAFFTGAALLLYFLLSNVFVYWFISQEHTIYTWDNAGYWTSSRNVSEFLQGAERKSVARQASALDAAAANQSSRDPGEAVPAAGTIAALIRNIRFAEYNVTTSIVVAPVMAAFGGSRMVYELSLSNIYAFAAVLMLILAVRACGIPESQRWPAWWPFIPVLFVIFFVPFWVPLLRGYMGISIVGINLAVLWLYFRQPIRCASTASLIAIGLLLVCGVLLQRWNAYWVVGFFILAFVDSLYETWQWRENRDIGVLQCFRAPLVIGFTAFFVFAIVAWPKIVTMATTDYADIFSAYLEHTSLLTAFVRLVSAFGLVSVLLIMTSIAYLALAGATRRISLLLSIQLIYIFVHLSSTQTMGPHHLYLLMPAIFILVCVAALHSMSTRRPGIVAGGAVLSSLMLISGMASAVSVFVPSDTKVAKPTSIGAISLDYRPPLARNDLNEFIRLAKYIDANLDTESDEGGIYVLAGSQILNAEHFKNFSASTGIAFISADRILPAAIVDKRDGFPAQILRAQLVVTSNPVQLSRRPSDQQVIQIPAASMLAGTGIGAAFERLPATFELDGSVEVIVFRRVRPNRDDEVAELSEKLKGFYPDRPYVYE